MALIDDALLSLQGLSSDERDRIANALIDFVNQLNSDRW